MTTGENRTVAQHECRVAVTDIAERKLLESVARIQHSLSAALTSAATLRAALGSVLEAVCQIEGIDGGGAYVVDPITGDLTLVAHRGFSAEFVAAVAHYPADSPQAELVRRGEGFQIVYSESRAAIHPALEPEGLRAVFVAPFSHEGRPVGSLQMASRTLDELPWITQIAIDTLASRVGGVWARIQAENSLARTQRNLQAVFDTLGDLLLIFDTQGRFVQANPAVPANLGYSLRELAGMTVYDFHPPELRPQVESLMARMLAGTADVCDLPILRKDGTRMDAETKVSRGTWDNQDVIIGITRDVSARKRIEQALRASEERLSLIVWATTDAVWDCNLATNTVWWNDTYSSLFGSRPQEVRDSWQWWIDHVHPEDRERVVGALQATLESSGSHCVAEYRFQRLDGTWATVVDRAYVARDADGKPHRILGAMQDISSQKRSEEHRQLLQSQLAHMGRLSTMGELVAAIAHEVNQPLYSIVNYAKACGNLLSQGQPNLGELSEWTREISVAAVRAGEIIKRLRNFLRRPEVQRAPVRINEVVDESVALMAFETHRHQAIVRQLAAEADPVAAIDRIQIQQVLVNLLRNACEAVSENPIDTRSITVQTVLNDGFVEVSVADNGPGLPEFNGQDIFAAFVTSKPQGLGMGLPISRTIIESHGGRIRAENGPRGGAVFCFTLPVQG